MTPFWATFKRELRGLWVTPLAWVLLVTFLVLQGGVFYSITVHFSQLGEGGSDGGPLQAYFGKQSLLMAFTLLLLCPALTMRSFAEERKSGSIELLLSAPISAPSLVLGKYLSVFITYLLIWCPTTLYAYLLRETGSLHWPTLLSSYLGIALVGLSYLALGLLMSALSKSQLIALLLTSGLIFGLFVLGIGEYIFADGLLRDFSAYVSLTSFLEETSKGVLDTRRLTLHFSLTAWALFVTTRVVGSWRSA